jgi:Tol biopolymer transport system component
VAGPQNFESFSLSGDGQRVMAGVIDGRAGSGDLWIFELGREAPSRFTFHEGAEFSPVWSPDGRRVAFAFDSGGGSVAMSQKALDESGNGTSLGLGGNFQIPHSWSSDGGYLLYSTNDPKTQGDLWVLPTSGDRKPVPFLQSAFDEPDGRFSPDGKWIAFVSDESGRLEIYVAAFPPSGEKRRISAAGGSQPRWRRDGKELFYLAPDSRIMAVAVAPGGAFQAGPPAPLFRIESASWNRLETSIWDDYEVSADGGRFLVNLGVTRTETLPFTVILNWSGDARGGK